MHELGCAVVAKIPFLPNFNATYQPFLKTDVTQITF